MEVVYLVIGLVIGMLIGWLIVNLSGKGKTSKLISEKSVLQEKVTALQQQLEKLQQNFQDKDEKILSLTGELSKKDSDFEHLQQKLMDQKQEVEGLQEKFKTEFKNLANEILDEKTKKFTQSNKENLGEILKPLGEKIREFEKKVEDTYEKGLKDQTDLKLELKRLHELSTKLDEDARNLTNALRSDTKKQGNWGEVVLERVLEKSGLVRNQEYIIQSKLRNDEGEWLQPDVIVNLPDDKHIVVDSKVSLLAYDSYVNEDEPDKKQPYLKQHLDSIKAHVRNLSEKNYQNLLNIDTPDFVLLFMPIESAFSIAIQQEADLFNYAWERKIVIVSPSTLLATLRTVASIWKHEKQTQNAMEIARQGGALYDKFVLFHQDLQKLGNQIGLAQRTYDDAYKKLSTGKGNLMRSADKLRKLGAKAAKRIPQNLIADEDEE
ncbi:MAG: DNA recombination protein RmuC [Bacteroidales bacterium]|nr:DNA recombination protein RmuC [Bacteroidales bacterium]MCF8349667.1 DNA recombination protein RmuC [Bacteroidales bacterium]MCF8374913.1 DNA recombination protein RmuC [Bacteroidales bacterium]MCF8400108.1 DNA recombination protein RmuC [Bacteroidales bacterium]